MKIFELRVADLHVIEYTKIVCPHDPPHTWNLSEILVTVCAYYHCAKTGDRKYFDDYIDLWAIRTPGEKGKRTYNRFLKLLDQVRNANGYRAELAGRETMRVHIGTTCLYDGHNRAAIICALFGPDTVVPLEEGPDPFLEDLDLCKRHQTACSLTGELVSCRTAMG
jgi:hypothetical protein